MLKTLEMTKMANPSLVPCSLVCSAHFLVRNSCRRYDSTTTVMLLHGTSSLTWDVGVARGFGVCNLIVRADCKPSMGVP